MIHCCVLVALREGDVVSPPFDRRFLVLRVAVHRVHSLHLTLCCVCGFLSPISAIDAISQCRLLFIEIVAFCPQNFCESGLQRIPYLRSIPCCSNFCRDIFSLGAWFFGGAQEPVTFFT